MKPLRLTAYSIALFSAAFLALVLNILPAAAQSTAIPIGIVTGHVTNGTAASTVPPSLNIALVVSAPGAAAQQFKATTNPDGSFAFTDVPLIPDADYVAATLYRDHIFSSTFAKVGLVAAAIDLPITIYEPTEDPSVLSIIGTVIQVNKGATTLEFRQVIRFRNTSDRIFTSSQDLGDGRYASLVIPLPPGAQVISFDDPNRYVVSPSKFTIVDTAPVFPGDDNQALVVYILPYDGSASIIEQPFNYPFDGQVRLLLSPPTLVMKSEQLPPLDKETLADVDYQAYGAALKLQPSDFIRYEISDTGGANPPVNAASTAAAANNNGAVIMVVVVVVGIALVALLFVLRMRPPAAPSAEQLIDALNRQIEALDQQHAAGELNHDLWHRQRTPLQARLNQLTGEEDSD